jgi:hypothetical protein
MSSLLIIAISFSYLFWSVELNYKSMICLTLIPSSPSCCGLETLEAPSASQSAMRGLFHCPIIALYLPLTHPILSSLDLPLSDPILSLFSVRSRERPFFDLCQSRKRIRGGTKPSREQEKHNFDLRPLTHSILCSNLIQTFRATHSSPVEKFFIGSKVSAGGIRIEDK